ncbi:MAG: RHS repeat-associated core domain-containing protein, partial [bacterium F083]
QTVTKNTIHFRRGYTGHEMMPEFGLVNMNGRLYDPILGRFLSPDNFVQMPDFSQSFNRYAYCINNPLKFNDPSGEFAWWIGAALIGGAINVATNWDNIDDGWDFLGYFGVGAVAGIAGGYAATSAAGAISVSGVIGGAVSGLAGGVVSGFVLGGGNSLVTNGNFDSFLESAITGAVIGGVTGAVIGGVVGGYQAHKAGNNIWTGEKIVPPYQRPTITEPDVMPNHPKVNYLDEPTPNCDVLINSDIELNKSITPYYPPNDGALNGWETEILEPGTLIDRYGNFDGAYFSPKGTPIEMRSLSPNNSMQYNSFKVIKPLTVKSSIVAPWHYQMGYGIQYKSNMSVEYLIEFKFIIPF